MDRETELRLVERLRRGDEAAFDAFYDEYRARLFAFLVRLSRRRDVAEDLLEETWLRLVVKAPSLAPDTRLLAWLFTVARNLYWSYCRSRLLDEDRMAALARLWPFTDRRTSPFEAIAGRETASRIERALARLSRADRETLLLVAVEGLDPAEAAAACGVRPEALRQRLSRARTRLAEALEAVERRPAGEPREVLT
jgi:RNA polymerase sigma-70 factor (ECF subfamily)